MEWQGVASNVHLLKRDRRDGGRETAWWDQGINPYPAISFIYSKVSSQATTPVSPPEYVRGPVQPPY